VPNGAQCLRKPFLLATFNANKLLGPPPLSISQLKSFTYRSVCVVRSVTFGLCVFRFSPSVSLSSLCVRRFPNVDCVIARRLCAVVEEERVQSG
jgi:hypothetical protein